MIDREARQEIRTAVDGFLDGSISAFDLDERLTAIETDDATAREAIWLLWFTYDDLKDHGPELWEKPAWDFVQRLLLLLDSDSEIESTKGQRTWGWSQAVALGALGLMAWLYWGVYHHWFFPVLIGGAISMAIALWRDLAERRQGDDDPTNAAPFASPGEIRRVLRQMPGWKKRRHPGGRSPRLRPRCFEWVYGLNARFLWCMVSPVALALQALPARESSSRVVVPAK